MYSKIIRIILLSFILGSVVLGGVGLAAENSTAETQLFLPIMFFPQPEPELTDIWVEDAANSIRNTAFSPGESTEYWSRGINDAGKNIDVNYTWNQTGPCGSALVYSNTITLSPGNWSFSHAGAVPTCMGTYTNVAEITIEDHTSTRITTFQVLDTSSQIIISEAHGFEKCGLPSIEQMEIWKQESPYDVFNIYLGGDHFACNLLIDADWVQATAAQGWDFILTWAGHGTSCWEAGKSNYHPISSDPAEAHQEGREAAEEAIAAARDLGFLGPKIIYYDVEGYSDVDPTCRPAMDAFLESWTTRLHEAGDKAGAYGSPCRSYITEDWVDHNPILDDIWFARWSYDTYDKDASVWDSPSVSCPLPNDVWAGQQRLRQYAGDHNETWGPCDEDDDTCTINGITSNVIYGEITRVLLENVTSSEP